jgi:hypothetical protein
MKLIVTLLVFLFLFPIVTEGVTRTRDIPITHMATLVANTYNCAYAGEPTAFLQEGTTGFKSRIVLTTDVLSNYIPNGAALISATLRLYILKPPISLIPQAGTTRFTIYKIYNETAQDPSEAPEMAYRTYWIDVGSGYSSTPNYGTARPGNAWFIYGCGKDTPASDTDGVANISTDTAWVTPADTNSWVELNLAVADVDTMKVEEKSGYLHNYYGWAIYTAEAIVAGWSGRKFIASPHYEIDVTKVPVIRVQFETDIRSGFRK